MGTEIKIFVMNDCEWWAAETLEAAIADYKETYGADGFAEQCPDPIEQLSEAALDGLQYTRQEEEGEPVGKVSFRKQLEFMLSSDCEFPCMFATTEY